MALFGSGGVLPVGDVGSGEGAGELLVERVVGREFSQQRRRFLVPID